MVNLQLSPSHDQLLELSELIKSMEVREEYGTLEKVLEVLHSFEKENMCLSKNGVMSFRMNKIHLSTYYRVKKVIGMSEEGPGIIEWSCMLVNFSKSGWGFCQYI